MERKRSEYLQTYVALHTIGLFALALAFSPETKKEAWKRCEGLCEMCDIKLLPGNRKLHHIFPARLFGIDDSLENSKYLCKKCEHQAHYELYLAYGDTNDYNASIPQKK